MISENDLEKISKTINLFKCLTNNKCGMLELINPAYTKDDLEKIQKRVLKETDYQPEIIKTKEGYGITAYFFQESSNA
ncbi:MAG: hypothetical protein ABFQ65_03480 [Nanoarchaeota archaeon]